MKKILSLGLFIIICGSFMVGCQSKMTRDDIDKYEEQENKIEYNLKTASETLNSVITYSDLIWSIEDQKEIDDLYRKMADNQDTIDQAERDLNKISLNKLLNFHNYMVEYRGTTQEKEDNKFMSMNYQYLLAKRRLAYADKIISLYSDGTLSSDEHDRIQNIDYLSTNYLNDDMNKNIKTLQDELDKEYSLDSKGLSELYGKLRYINEEELNG
ncbi:hypothetical protein [Terrisporobacter petrolearius]|uniref:hypothetical protein n=1 Tax=Terrisporobacter petrolearius TaxID=1460447 RepID=UPI003AFF9078